MDKYTHICQVQYIPNSLQADAHDKTEEERHSWLPGKQATHCPVPSDQGTRSSKTKAVLSLWPAISQKTWHLPYTTKSDNYYGQACLERCNAKTSAKKRWPRQPDSQALPLNKGYQKATTLFPCIQGNQEGKHT